MDAPIIVRCPRCLRTASWTGQSREEDGFQIVACTTPNGIVRGALYCMHCWSDILANIVMGQLPAAVRITDAQAMAEEPPPDAEQPKKAGPIGLVPPLEN